MFSQKLTFLLSVSKASHIDATILDTSPKLALGFDPLIAAWVSLKNNAYAETGLKTKENLSILLQFYTQRDTKL